MGLAQRRIMTEYKEKNFPKWKEQIDAAAGFSVTMEVNWDTLPYEEYTDRDYYIESIDAVYFRPLLEVVKNVCVDDMGKTAFREGVKKITFDGTEGSSPDYSTFENGEFKIKHRIFSNVSDEKDRIRVWQKMIEAML